MDLGPSELIIILLIVALLFGPGRIANLGGELGKAIHEFRKGLAQGPTEVKTANDAKPVENEISSEDKPPV
jgi:sec-independent protein translocase protein TatA